MEPTLRDIFVEGTYDEKIIRTFLRGEDPALTSVFVINSVEVEDEILNKHSLTRGERNELIAFAREIFESLGQVPGFTGVIDADYDYLLGDASNAQLLLRTDFTCMESYFIETATIDRFYSWLGLNEHSMAELENHVGPVARTIFLIRAALQVLNLGVRILPIRKYCTTDGNVVTIDRDSYFQSLLMGVGGDAAVAQVKLKISELELLASSDMRNSINGHDFSELLFLAYRNKLALTGLRDAPSVHNLIRLLLPFQDLSSYPLFQSLVQRVAQLQRSSHPATNAVTSS